MSVWVGLKVLGDVCVYFSVIAAFPKLFACDFFFLWPALACAAGAGLSVFLSVQSHYGKRGLCMLLPCLAFLLCDSLIEVLVLLPVLLYCLIVVLRGGLELEYYGYRVFFKRSFIAWCIYYLVICLLCYFERATNPEQGLLNYEAPLLCGVIYGLSGVLLLRQLRLGAGNRGGRLNGLQLVAVFGCTALLLGGIVLLERLLQRYATSLIELLKKLAIFLFTAPLTVVTQAISRVLPGGIELTDEPQQNPVQYTEPPVEGQLPPPVLSQSVESTVEPGFPWWLVVLILVAMAAILLYMLKVLHKRKENASAQEIRGYVKTAEKDVAAVDRSNRGRVRQLYRSFLRQQRNQGLQLDSTMTTADVQAGISPRTDPVQAQKLRQIYLVARYSQKRETTADALRAARAALRDSRGKTN